MFAALLAPAALSLLATTFTDPAERGKAFGIYGAIAGAGGAFGLLLGGVLTEVLDWRWCLYVSILFAVPAAIGGAAPAPPRARHRTGRGSTSRARCSPPPASSRSCTACRGPSPRAGAIPVTLAFLGAGVVLLVGFVALQRRVAHPLLPLRVVTDRNRGGAFLAIAIAGAGIFGVFLFLTFYLQSTQGLSRVRDRPRVPADEPLDHRHGDAGEHEGARPDRTAPAHPDRHGPRRRSGWRC